MFKKIAILTAWCTLAFSEPIDAIALVVEGEPITLLEIKALQKQKMLSKQEAIDVLIVEKLRQAALRKIAISEEEIDAKIGQIAARNGISVAQMQEILEQQGVQWGQYREDIKAALQKEKFITQKLLPSIPDPSEDELKLYYLHHQEEFKLPKLINTTRFESDDPRALSNFSRTLKRSSSIKVHKQTIRIEDAPIHVFVLLAKIPKGGFSPMSQTDEGYVIYRIDGKKGSVTPPYEMVRSAVLEAWKKQKQAAVIDEYFQKMRTNAHIEVLRP